MDRVARNNVDTGGGDGVGRPGNEGDENNIAIVVQNSEGAYRVVYIPARYATSMDPQYINDIVSSRYGDEWVYVPTGEGGAELNASPTTHQGRYGGQMSWLNQQVQENNAPITQSKAAESAVRTGASDPDPLYSDPALHANPNDYVAKDPVTGASITDEGWRESRDSSWRMINNPESDGSRGSGSPMPQKDIYGNPIDPYSVTGVAGPVSMSAGEMATANRTVLPQHVMDDIAVGKKPGSGMGNQPYNLTGNDVELHSMLNKGANSDDLSRYYAQSQGIEGSMSADFAGNYWDYYDDIWALQNPGMAMPDQYSMYGNTQQFMSDMSGSGEGNLIGTLDGYTLWDNQFTDQYMNSERGRGSGESFDEISTSQYNQIISNIQAMTPSMGSRNAQMIASMVDRSYDDYRDLQLRNSPGVQSMTFLQYLQSIGAEDWF